jgi:hypothetical protein
LFTAGVAVRCLPFRRLSRRFGALGQASPEDAAPASLDAAQRTAWAIAAAARGMPWPCKCLEQALAARAMLQSRGVSSTLYIGVETTLSADAQALHAHAWLRSGSVIVCGDAVRGRFATLVSYGDDPGAPAKAEATA